MPVATGSHPIGPQNGKLRVKTYVAGMAAKMGHDLVMEVADWHGTVMVNVDDPSSSSVELEIDPRSLHVVQANGGLKPLSDNDRTEISHNLEKTLQAEKYPQISFRSSAVAGNPPDISLTGDLTIAGKTRPVILKLSIGSGGDVTGGTSLNQTDFGIKPYSKLGALKVKDGVDVTFESELPIT